MNNLNLNVSNIRKNCELTKSAILKYKENMSTYFTSLGNVDTVWKDNNTEFFIKKVNKDKIAYLDQVSSMNKNLIAIEDFCADLEIVFSRNLNISTLNNVRYLQQATQNAQNILDECRKGIVNLKNKFASMYVPYESGYESTIKNMMSDIDEREIISLKSKIDNTIDGINESIRTSQATIGSIELSEIDQNVCNFRYKTVQAENLKRVVNEREKQTYVSSTVIDSILSNSSVDLEKANDTSSNVINPMIKEDENELDQYEKEVNRSNIGSINDDSLINLDDKRIASEKTLSSNISDNNISLNSLQDVNSKNIDTLIDDNITLNGRDTGIFDNTILTDIKSADVNLSQLSEVNKNTMETSTESLNMAISDAGNVNSKNIETNIGQVNVSIDSSSSVNEETIKTNIGDVKNDVHYSKSIEDIISE